MLKIINLFTKMKTFNSYRGVSSTLSVSCQEVFTIESVEKFLHSSEHSNGTSLAVHTFIWYCLFSAFHKMKFGMFV